MGPLGPFSGLVGLFWAMLGYLLTLGGLVGHLLAMLGFLVALSRHLLTHELMVDYIVVPRGEIVSLI